MKTYKQVSKSQTCQTIKETVHGDTGEQTSFSFKFPLDPVLYLSRNLWESLEST